MLMVIGVCPHHMQCRCSCGLLQFFSGLAAQEEGQGDDSYMEPFYATQDPDEELERMLREELGA